LILICIIRIIEFILLFLVNKRKHRFGFSNHFTRSEPTLFTNFNKSPIKKSTFPEFSKININCSLDLIFGNNISRFNFMPCYQILVISKNRGRSGKTNKILKIIIIRFAVIIFNRNINNKMLANRPYDWSESFLKLPINFIIQHIQKNNWLIPHHNITESH
jgi:hypothetical protein